SVTGVRVGLVMEQCLAPVPGGTGRYSSELARALAATAPDGSTVTGWTAWHRDVAAARVPGVAGPRRLTAGRRALGALWARGVGPGPRDGDVTHAPTLFAPPRRRRPLVVTIHDAVPWTHPETLTRYGVAWHRRMAARVARTADLVVVPTEAVAAELTTRLGLAGRVVVIGEGVSADLAAPPDAAERRRRLGIGDEAYAVTVATLEPRKGLDVALDALAHPSAADVPLVVVGPRGWGGIDVDAAAAQRGLTASQVRALGRVSDQDLAAVVSGATMLVAPSRAEGFGLPVIEAMSLGVPVVVSSAPALVEVAGDAAVVTPVGDAVALAAAMADLLDDAGRRADLARRGRARAARFTWRAAADALWAAYHSLAGRS
ncbi:MAG: glycosyltransferase family 4 protein, partial [Mycobacteriales bacterium]